MWRLEYKETFIELYLLYFIFFIGCLIYKEKGYEKVFTLVVYSCIDDAG